MIIPYSPLFLYLCILSIAPHLWNHATLFCLLDEAYIEKYMLFFCLKFFIILFTDRLGPYSIILLHEIGEFLIFSGSWVDISFIEFLT